MSVEVLPKQVNSRGKGEKGRDEVFDGMACWEKARAYFSTSYLYACRSQNISGQMEDARKQQNPRLNSEYSVRSNPGQGK